MDMNNPLEDLLAKKAQAKAEMAKATSAAEALLADLEAQDAVNATANTVPESKYKMPSAYAPGDPRAGVAPSGGDQLKDALENSFKPVNMSNLSQTTLPSSKVVDFAQKIRDAHKPHGSH
jgi:hypothetical protein